MGKIALYPDSGKCHLFGSGTTIQVAIKKIILMTDAPHMCDRVWCFAMLMVVSYPSRSNTITIFHLEHTAIIHSELSTRNGGVLTYTFRGLLSSYTASAESR
jgi:hypothetical protein